MSSHETARLSLALSNTMPCFLSGSFLGNSSANVSSAEKRSQYKASIRIQGAGDPEEKIKSLFFNVDGHNETVQESKPLDAGTLKWNGNANHGYQDAHEDNDDDDDDNEDNDGDVDDDDDDDEDDDDDDDEEEHNEVDDEVINADTVSCSLHARV